jgi:circadian clock protein KaiC
MKNLGMDFEKMEKKGLFKFVYTPTISSKNLAGMFSETMVKEVVNFGAEMLVIDSITPLLKAFGEKIKAREYLHSGIYQLTEVLNVTAILIADLPWGEETIDLGGIEFVADAVLVFKTKIENGLLTRRIEIRKMRGSSIPLAEIPFSIVKGVGVRMFIPPMLGEIPAFKRKEIYKIGCKELDDGLGGIPQGAQVAIIYPPGLNTPDIVYAFLADLMVKNNLRTLVISYTFPGKVIVDRIIKAAESYGLDTNKVKKLIIGTYSFNPTQYSVPELVGHELTIIEKLKPNMLIMHGLRTVMDVATTKKVTMYQFNAVQIYKKLGIIGVRLIRADFPQEYIPTVEYSDVVLVIKYVGTKDSDFKLNYIAWKTLRKKPKMLNTEELEKCINKVSRRHNN